MRSFHNKVRTGCATCKQRRVKCDEGKPTCLRCRASSKECLGYPALPAAKIFEPSKETLQKALETSRSEHSPRAGGNPTDESILILPDPKSRESTRSSSNSDFSFNDTSTPLSILETITLGFSSASEKYSHDFFRHWLSSYTAPRAATVPELWTIHYPQVGSAVPAINSVMLANGAIGTSLLRKDTPEEYEKARLVALEHVASAISYLRKHPQPPHIVTMIAWLFWLLDMAQGFFQSSTMHIEGAIKIGTTNLTHPATPEEAAIVQLLHDVRDSSNYTKSLEQAFPDALSRSNPPHQRMAASITLFRSTVSEILVAQLKLAFNPDPDPNSTSTSNTSLPLSPADKAKLLTSLRRVRRELEWLCTRWSSRIAHLTDLPSPSPPAERSSSSTPATLLSPYLEEISTGTHTRSVETLQVTFARAVPVFVSRASHDDIEMRQDLVELLQLVSGEMEGEER